MLDSQLYMFSQNIGNRLFLLSLHRGMMLERKYSLWDNCCDKLTPITTGHWDGIEMNLCKDKYLQMNEWMHEWTNQASNDSGFWPKTHGCQSRSRFVKVFREKKLCCAVLDNFGLFDLSWDAPDGCLRNLGLIAGHKIQ